MMGDDKGSSMVYVILFITLLSLFSCGYMAISKYNMKSTLDSRNYIEARLTAKSIHRTFCESLSRDGSDVMDSIKQCFESDCTLVREEYDRMPEAEEGSAEEEGEAGSEQAHGLFTDERWERYLCHVLGEKEYVMRGTGKQKDGVKVAITVKAKPLRGFVAVTTKTECNGYRFSMRADIVFDHSQERLNGRNFRFRTSGRSKRAYLEGNAVYTYYEDERE